GPLGSAYMSRRESINPWILTGFADAEGSFLLRIRNNNKSSVGYSTELGFQITLHNKDKSILENIQSTWKVGVIANSGDNAVSLKVTRFEDLKVIIDHFEKYPLITQKLGDYMLFKQAFCVMENKEHLKINGIKELVRIKAKLNWGLTDELKKAFPEIISKERSLINKNIPNFKWLAGFTSGEGCFFVNLIKSKSKLGVQVQLVFSITQHIKDKNLMNSLITYLGCGYIKEKNKSEFSWLDFVVTKFSDINDKIIPVFQENTLIGVKLEDFEDWCKVAKLIEEKKHLTESGLDEIKKIKLNMNKGRVF
uniref:Ribosomal protein 3/homing endonuclease-like protein fusion n=1 Tax=Ophiostoma novo-ulmi subsp. americana TaxID=170178 RepID=UPI000219023E|nr:Chain A, Ribosomal protein 3/homing endonuclease-like protein fusion [Ophiostoma novo-ulmi subsp. americana]